MKLDADIVIVGTGPGGAVMAKELSEISGLKIIMVDAGPYVKKGFYEQSEIKMSQIYWDRTNRMTDDLSTQIAQAKCVGGGSIVYTGTVHKVPDFVLKEWRNKWKLKGFSRSDLERGYERVAKHMYITEHTSEDWNDNSRLFAHACEKEGFEWENLKRFVDRCVGCGFCYQGCKYNAKVTMINTYIPMALNNGVQLISNCMVNQVTYDKQTGRVNGIKGIVGPNPPKAEPNSVNPGPIEISAKLVVVAGGAINTPALLIKSKIPNLGPALGRFILMQNAHQVNIHMPYDVSMIRGVPKSASMKEFLNRKRFIITPSQLHPITTANDIMGFGYKWKNFMRNFHQFLQWQVICGDDPSFYNYVYLDAKGNTKVRYLYSKEYIQRQVNGLRVCAKLGFSVGAERIFLGPTKRGYIRNKDSHKIHRRIHRRYFSPGRFPLATAHPQGGCRMGGNPRHSVVDLNGRAHNVKGLIVCDASLFPSALHVNPVYTILAVASLIAERTIEDLNLLI